MKTFRFRLVAVVLVLLGWLSDGWENESYHSALLEVGKVYEASGNPVTYTLTQDLCASAMPSGALIIGVDANIQSTTSDQGYFRIGSGASSIQLETIPERFHVLQVVSSQSTDSQVVRLGQQAWLGNRKFALVIRGLGLMTAHGAGLTQKSHMIRIPRFCNQISVGGFEERGDFQGQITISLTAVKTQEEIEQVVQELNKTTRESLSPVVGRAFLYLGLLGLFLVASRTIKVDHWRKFSEPKNQY